MAKAANWKKIKTEYITTDTSYRKLADKYGIHYKVISERGKAEGWVELRAQHRNKTITKALDIISDRQADQMAGLVTQAAEALLVQAMTAIGQLDRPVTTHKHTIEQDGEKTTTEWEELATAPGAVNVAAVRHLATALKDISQVLGLKTELDRKEQEARIAALRQRSMTGDGDDDETGVVLLPPRIGEEADDG